MFKLFLANLKMTVRDRQRLFWSFMFPVLFTIIFGFFFGSGSMSTTEVVLINHSDSLIAVNLEKAMTDSEMFKIDTTTSIEKAKDQIIKGQLAGAIEVPADFGKPIPGAPTAVKVISDPGSAQAGAVLNSFLNNYLNQASFQVQNARPLFTIEQEMTNSRKLNYFDFVLMGLIGMALMNSSVQGVAIAMAQYREDQILKRITTTPIKTWKFIVAEVLSRMVINLLQIGTVLGIGYWGFGAHIYGNLFLLFVFGMIGAILFQSIGFVIASLAKTVPAAEGMAVAITIPMMFLAGVFFPTDTLPRWLSSIVQYLPLAPLLRMIRTIGLEASSPFSDPKNIAIVGGWIVICLLISSFKFRLTEE